jgi:hypothetical protein
MIFVARREILAFYEVIKIDLQEKWKLKKAKFIL